ncbi:hypothetical protein Asal01_00965 [Fodinibius salicampi]
MSGGNISNVFFWDASPGNLPPGVPDQLIDGDYKAKIPVYLDHANRGQGIRPGRNEVESVNATVVVGGVQVNPGDVIVADGDGVIIVPRKHAREVAKYAREILKSDKEARRALYEELGIPLDETVKENN